MKRIERIKKATRRADGRVILRTEDYDVLVPLIEQAAREYRWVIKEGAKCVCHLCKIGKRLEESV